MIHRCPRARGNNHHRHHKTEMLRQVPTCNPQPAAAILANVLSFQISPLRKLFLAEFGSSYDEYVKTNPGAASQLNTLAEILWNPRLGFNDICEIIHSIEKEREDEDKEHVMNEPQVPANPPPPLPFQG